MKTEIDLLPASLIYKDLLAKAVVKFGIKEKEARARYGQFTVAEWDKLLAEPERKPVKYTSGPWTIHTSFENMEIHPANDENGYTVIADVCPNDCEVPIKGTEKTANAKLIAAAPEMVDVLLRFYEAFCKAEADAEDATITMAFSQSVLYAEIALKNAGIEL